MITIILLFILILIILILSWNAKNDQDEKILRIYIEKHGSTFYMYNAETNLFLFQFKKQSQLTDFIQKYYNTYQVLTNDQGDRYIIESGLNDESI